MRTQVIQSYNANGVSSWIKTCTRTVKDWSNYNNYTYQYVNDRIFEYIPDWYLRKTLNHKQISTDLGRLCLMQEALSNGFERVIWLDSDVLIFSPKTFQVTVTRGFEFGREIWVQASRKGTLEVFYNVHNAYCLFCADNKFLDFYQYACERVISQMESKANKGMSPQIVGPKLLTSLNNILKFKLSDDIIMLSPEVLNDLYNGGGDAIDLLKANLKAPPSGANLSASLTKKYFAKDKYFMDKICEILLESSHALKQES